MATLEIAVKAEIEQCIRWQVFIPPCVMPDGRKLIPVDTLGHITGVMPPIDFLLYDKNDNSLLPARFYPIEMKWEILDG